MSSEMRMVTRRPYFPERIGLVNPHITKGFGMLFLKECLIPDREMAKNDPFATYDCVLSGDVPEKLILNFTTSHDTCDAIFAHRPYVRILGEGDTSCALEGKVRFVVDGEMVADLKLSDLLLRDPFTDISKEPFPWLETNNLFLANEMHTSAEVILKKKLGLFLSNVSKVQAFVYDFKGHGNGVQVEAGIVAAMYTTRASKLV